MSAEKIKWDSGYIYEDTNFPEEPKENFKAVLNQIKNRVGNNSFSHLDLGCASGEFIHYVIKEFPAASCLGIDFNSELIQLAKQTSSLSKAQFEVGDVTSFSLGKKFDVVSMVGVLTCFEEFQPILDRMINHTKIGGAVYIVSIFNDDNIDVRLKFRNNDKNKNWEVGYNLFPIQEVIKYAIQKGAKQVNVKDILLPFDLPKQQDPLRSWTVNLEPQGRYCLNGLMLLYRLKCVEIVL